MLHWKHTAANMALPLSNAWVRTLYVQGSGYFCLCAKSSFLGQALYFQLHYETSYPWEPPRLRSLPWGGLTFLPIQLRLYPCYRAIMRKTDAPTLPAGWGLKKGACGCHCIWFSVTVLCLVSLSYFLLSYFYSIFDELLLPFVWWFRYLLFGDLLSPHTWFVSFTGSFLVFFHSLLCTSFILLFFCIFSQGQSRYTIGILYIK